MELQNSPWQDLLSLPYVQNRRTKCMKASKGKRFKVINIYRLKYVSKIFCWIYHLFSRTCILKDDIPKLVKYIFQYLFQLKWSFNWKVVGWKVVHSFVMLTRKILIEMSDLSASIIFWKWELNFIDLL